MNVHCVQDLHETDEQKLQAESGMKGVSDRLPRVVAPAEGRFGSYAEGVWRGS